MPQASRNYPWDNCKGSNRGKAIVLKGFELSYKFFIPLGMVIYGVNLDFTGMKDERLIISASKAGGTGIAEEDIDKIFSPFFTTKEKGIGLGFSIVQRIVSSHQGEIKVKSNLKRLLIKLSLFILLLFLKTGFSFDIRVCVARGKNLIVSSSSYYEVITQDGVITRRYAVPISFKANSSFIEIEGYGVFSPPVIIEPLNSDISISKRKYRGNMEININNRELLAINTIDIEKYLYGVIKMEIDPKWPYETVKAQAIIARTFVYKNLGKHRNSGFDFCNGVHCQVYAGINAEDDIAIRAVDETKGELLYYGDSLASVYYHSVCGGKTASPVYTWEGAKNIPYLSEIICPYCKDAPHYYWNTKLKFSDISQKLNIGKVYSISKYPENGRAQMVIIKHSGGVYKMLGSQFRRAFGENLIKSTFFNISQERDSVFITGRGYGHGVGLCQWGAKGMGELGFLASEILSFYFPGCVIKRVVEE